MDLQEEQARERFRALRRRLSALAAILFVGCAVFLWSLQSLFSRPSPASFWLPWALYFMLSLAFLRRRNWALAALCLAALAFSLWYLPRAAAVAERARQRRAAQGLPAPTD